MSQTNSAELTSRYRTALLSIIAMLALTILLVALAFGHVRFPLPASLNSPSLSIALWIAILIFGLGAVALRRTKFSAMRLQDIADLKGLSGLLQTLQKTTMLVALIGGAIALMGYFLSVMSGEPTDMLKAGVVAAAVLLHSYPRRAAWLRVAQATQQPGGLDAPPAKGTPA